MQKLAPPAGVSSDDSLTEYVATAGGLSKTVVS